MGRHKGSRNRTTLIAELAARGGVAEKDLVGAAYEDLGAKLAALEAAKPKPPEPIEKTVVDPELARAVIARTRQKFDSIVEYYAPGGMDVNENPVEVPERIQEYLRKAFYAGNAEQLEVISHAAFEKLFIHMMVLWSRKRITGPNTPENIEARAKSAESWAIRLEKEGKTAEAVRQREKAATIRATSQVGFKLFF